MPRRRVLIIPVQAFALAMALLLMSQQCLALPLPTPVFRGAAAAALRLTAAGAGRSLLQQEAEDAVKAALADLETQYPPWLQNNIAAAQRAAEDAQAAAAGGKPGRRPKGMSEEQAHVALDTLTEWLHHAKALVDQHKALLVKSLITGRKPPAKALPRTVRNTTLAQLTNTTTKVAGTTADDDSTVTAASLGYAEKCGMAWAGLIWATVALGVQLAGFYYQFTPALRDATMIELTAMNSRESMRVSFVAVNNFANTKTIDTFIPLAGEIFVNVMPSFASALINSMSWLDGVLLAASVLVSIASALALGPAAILAKISAGLSIASCITAAVDTATVCSNSGDGSTTTTPAPGATFSFIGCIVDEARLPATKTYGGGAAAASYKDSVAMAASRGDKYFAVARTGPYGYSFTFDTRPYFPLTINNTLSIVGCTSTCVDDNSKFCGSGDYYNNAGTGQPKTNRVWAVYLRDVYDFIGCTTDEANFGSDRSYFGGEPAANYRQAANTAATRGHRYIALARTGQYGHGFSFNAQPVNMPWRVTDIVGCQSACADNPGYYCGSGDGFVTSGPRPRSGRAWAVYIKGADMCSSSPTYRYQEAPGGACNSDCHCDGLRTCSLQGICIGSRASNWCGPKTARFLQDERENGQCFAPCDCDGQRTCSSGMCGGGSPRPSPLALSLPASTALIGGRIGQYCSDQPDRFRCDVSAWGAWETFSVQFLSDTAIALKSGRTGQYCSDQPDRFRCDVPVIGAWETFTVAVYADTNKLALRSGRTGLFCSDQWDAFRCNVSPVGAWEKFGYASA